MKTSRKAAAAQRQNDVLLYIDRNNGCTIKDVLHSVYRDVANRNYGRQSTANFAVAALRAKGLLEDDCSRCPHCQRAARGRRNVELKITDAGRKKAAELRAERLSNKVAA